MKSTNLIGHLILDAVLPLGLAGCAAGFQTGPPPASAAEAAAAVEAAAAGEAASGSSSILFNAQESLWKLCELVLAAIREENPESLLLLMVTEEEYKEILFPEFGASLRRSVLTVDHHWALLLSKSFKGIQECIRDHGGRDFELIEAAPSRGIQEYESFRLHRRVRLKVRDRLSGREANLDILGSIVELDGHFKILSFPS